MWQYLIPLIPAALDMIAGNSAAKEQNKLNAAQRRIADQQYHTYNRLSPVLESNLTGVLNNAGMNPALMASQKTAEADTDAYYSMGLNRALQGLGQMGLGNSSMKLAATQGFSRDAAAQKAKSRVGLLPQQQANIWQALQMMQGMMNPNAAANIYGQQASQYGQQAQNAGDSAGQIAQLMAMMFSGGANKGGGANKDGDNNSVTRFRNGGGTTNGYFE